MSARTPGPWRVMPDQPSHGCSLCVEADTPNGSYVIVRTPEVDKYNNKEQRTIDLPNIQFIVTACNAHDALARAVEHVLSASEDGGTFDDVDFKMLRDALAEATV